MAFGDQFADKVAVVTGSSQGIGEATARLFAKRGAAGLVICGPDAANGERVAAEITASGSPTRFVEVDLTRTEDCFRVIDAAAKEFGRIDSLVNCAGSTDRGLIEDTTPEFWDRMYALNVRAPFFLLQRTVSIMRSRSIEGTIVNLVTIMSHSGAPHLIAYASSKGALASLTRVTAKSLLKDRIRVNGLNIGWTDTPGERHAQLRWHQHSPQWFDAAAKRQPFGRLIRTSEVAQAIAFLASSESGLMTGTVVDYDQSVVGAAEAADINVAGPAEP
jgi:NAD(P)-dependent dehydrogenase (short-subunit alcohol dehydrogenase family)